MKPDTITQSVFQNVALIFCFSGRRYLPIAGMKPDTITDSLFLLHTEIGFVKFHYRECKIENPVLQP